MAEPTMPQSIIGRANRQEGDVGNGLYFLVMHRAMSSSLCPNQGGGTCLVVDGRPVGTKAMTEVGNSLQASVSPGSTIVALIQSNL